VVDGKRTVAIGWIDTGAPSLVKLCTDGRLRLCGTLALARQIKDDPTGYKRTYVYVKLRDSVATAEQVRMLHANYGDRFARILVTDKRDGFLFAALTLRDDKIIELVDLVFYELLGCILEMSDSGTYQNFMNRK